MNEPRMDDLRAEVIAHAEAYDGRPLRVADDEDLFEHLGIDGDDADEFLEPFVARFNVDMSPYRWYFHHGEEGWSIGALFIKPPYRRVKRIPITVDVLVEAARSGRWPVAYPEHSLPQRRWDVWITRAVLLGLIFISLLMLLSRWAAG